MLQKAWWAALYLCLWTGTSGVSWADTLTIPFTKLEDYAERESAQAVILDRQLKLISAERDEALQWSNPEIAFDREDVGLAENQFTLGKTFEVPWAYWRNRASWRTRVDAANSAHESGTRQLLANLKTDYVRLRLLDDQLDRLSHLEAIIPDVSRVIASRRTEGHISGIDEQLVRMVLVTLHTARQQALRTRGEVDAEWRALMGIEPETPVRLSTPIPFRTVAVESSASYAVAVESNPGYQSRRLQSDFFRSQAGVAKGRFIPSVGLYGGYKEIELNETGYVLGVSLTLPLFNRSGAQARQHEIRAELANREADAFRIQATMRVDGLVKSINASQAAMSSIGELPEGSDLTSALLQSYEEGWISLHELLNAIQVTVTGLTDYHEQLAALYADVFELEAITGKSVIELSSEE